MPTHALFISLIYPIAGLVIAIAVSGTNLLWLIYPMATGFALIGPVAAVGLYELSRRREQGLDTDWSHAFDLLQAESFRSIAALGLVLLAPVRRSGSASRRRSTGPISATPCRSRSTTSRGRC